LRGAGRSEPPLRPSPLVFHPSHPRLEASMFDHQHAHLDILLMIFSNVLLAYNTVLFQ
jgi:hypothetical protein